jgi:hypothetical protein
MPLKTEKGYKAKGYMMKLLMFKDEQGQMQTQVIKAIGTKALLEQDDDAIISDHFTGITEMRTWEGDWLSTRILPLHFWQGWHG